MNAYTLEHGCRLKDGIAITYGCSLKDGIAITYGSVFVGTMSQSQSSPVVAQVDPRATTIAGRLIHSPGRGAMLLIQDQSGPHGSWLIRGAHTAERWAAMLKADAIENSIDRILARERVRMEHPTPAPVGWYEFARGTSRNADHRMGINLYGWLDDGASFEIRRRGKLNGEPSVFAIACVDSCVTVTAPYEVAKGRRGR